MVMAESLLAYKAYIGGQPSDEVLAGAMHTCDSILSLMSLENWIVAYLKAVSKLS